MSKTMSRKDRKTIQKAEEIIAEVKQNGLKDGALIVLRATDEDGDISLNRMIMGKTNPTLATLCYVLTDTCKAFGVPLTRVIGVLLRWLDKEGGRYDETI